jgi:membrane fusion protein, multidrug efflux system
VNRGDRVNAGQVLARLNTSVIESNIEEVRTNLQMAETVYERQKDLWEQDIGSEIQYLEARNRYLETQSSLAINGVAARTGNLTCSRFPE